MVSGLLDIISKLVLFYYSTEVGKKKMMTMYHGQYRSRLDFSNVHLHPFKS